MNRLLKTALVAGLPVLWAAGCSDFLKCSECTHDPNRPTSATMRQRFEAIQANNWIFQEGDLARLISMWMQGMAGTDRQYQLLGTYVISEADEDGEFSRPYQGGGLIDLRALEDSAAAAGDQVFVGVAQVLEAWMIGTTADMWGDIPYSQAAKPDSFPTPVLDTQQDVYAALQALLDNAITNLSGSGDGPTDADLVYGGDTDKWIELAYTLKARLYLHTAEVVGNTAYQNALDAANKGLSSNESDYLSLHTTKPGEDNPWYQFIIIQRSGYISPGAFLVSLLDANNDPRLEDYFTAGTSAPGGTFRGAKPGEPFNDSLATLSSLRLGQAYRQPDVTYNENLLIKAEALYNLGQETAALDTLNKERAAWADRTDWHGAVNLPPVAAAGPALLQAIMTEKYITLFQNVEVWNDYKRTCIPALTPAGSATQIPARLYYGVTERQTNPNIPDVGSQPTRNWNDPNGC